MEKGGKASSTGLEFGPVKSKKRGRKPEINTEVRSDATVRASPLFGGKGDTFFSKGMPGKGISGEKTANAPKAPAPKEPIPLELKVESAAQILEGIQEQMVSLSEDPAIKIPVSFDRGLQYSKTSNYSDPSEVRRVLETLTKHGFSEGEMCVIDNVCPDTTDKVFALVLSLKKFDANGETCLTMLIFSFSSFLVIGRSVVNAIENMGYPPDYNFGMYS